MNQNKPVIYFRNDNDIDETIRLIEEEEWGEGDILFDDIKDFRNALGQGVDTKSDYEYIRDFLTYLINKEDYWVDDNN